MKLAGKVAIVTGATQGLGRDVALGLVAQGARVVIAGIDHEAGRAIAASLGDAARYVGTDIEDDAQIAQCIAATLAHFGQLDLLVNNACVYDDAGIASTRAQWLRTLNVNLVSAAIFAQQAAAVMPRGGVIVNLGSVGGKFGAAARATEDLLEGYERSLSDSERKQLSFFFVLGTQNHDVRGLALDGEASVVLSGFPASVGLVDLFYLMARTTWVESDGDIDYHVPAPGGFMAKLARLLRDVM